MSIKSNNSTEEVLTGMVNYSGLTNVKVVAVNPSLAELHAMDIMLKQEPVYSVEFTGEKFNKIVLWLQNADGTFKLEILMQDKARVSQTGKNQWMNNVGQATWSKESPAYDWWNKEGEREALVGEETLINFIKAWANVAQGDDVYLDTINDIAGGNVAELRSLIKGLSSNMARVLVGVKDDKYQQVYSKHFGRIKPQRDDFFIKELNSEYGAFNAEFNADLVWGPHVFTAEVLTADTDGDDDEEDWSMPDTPQNGEEKKAEVF